MGYYAHAQTVCTRQVSPRGGVGGGGGGGRRGGEGGGGAVGEAFSPPDQTSGLSRMVLDHRQVVKACKKSTVKPLITDPPKSGQPLYSGQLTCPRLILPWS